MKTLNKVETKFSAIEDNGGGLHLAVFEGSQCVAFFSGFEHNDGSLVESINALDDGFGDWDGNAEEPQADYDSMTSHQYGWALVADNDGIYTDKMGAAAQREFDVEADLMKTKQEVINEILESGAAYVKTSVSNEACAVSIAIRDIENIDDLPEGFDWVECSTGLDEEDY